MPAYELVDPGSYLRITLLLCVALAGACAHHYWMPAPELNVALRRSGDRRVAVVLAPPKLTSTYKTSVAAHTYYFEDVFSVVEQTLERGLRGQVREVRFFHGQAAPGFDAYLFPELSIEMDGGVFKKTCTVRFGIVVGDASGAVLSHPERSGKGSFAAMAQGSFACISALRDALIEATSDAARTIDAI